MRNVDCRSFLVGLFVFFDEGRVEAFGVENPYPMRLEVVSIGYRQIALDIQSDGPLFRAGPQYGANLLLSSEGAEVRDTCTGFAARGFRIREAT